MELLQSVADSLATPAVLFFVLGILATAARTDLRFPEPLYASLTMYLLVAIGFKGGVAVAQAGLGAVWLPALAAVALGALIPLWSYPILRYAGRFSPVDAAAVAAHYGSVSAVTFMAAVSYLQERAQPFEPYASALLAVMESPAIVVGVVLGRIAGGTGRPQAGALAKLALHEGLLGRSVFLLLGSMLVGFLSGERGMAATAGFFVTPFQGILALFLFEMGMVAARRFGDLRRVGPFLVGFGLAMPLVHGAIGSGLGALCGLSEGGSMLLGVLAASASYIAAPAAMRLSLPEANPTLYLTAALAITFPFNIVVGLPIYAWMARFWHEGGPLS